MMFDTWRYLGQFLKDVKRFHLMITSKEMMKLDLTFDEEHEFMQMFESSFYDNFTTISTDHVIHFVSKLKGWPAKLLKLDIHVCLLKINIEIPSTIKYLTIYENVEGTYIIPTSVTHLTLKNYLNKYENEYIPTSVTHLVFDNCDDTNMYYFRIPSSVTHLILNPTTFDGFIESFSNKFIPTSVTYLRFGEGFNQRIDGCIPNSVTHLVFGECFNYSIDNCIPNSVTHLVFGACFHQSVNNLPSSVRKIIFHDIINVDRKVDIKKSLSGRNVKIIFINNNNGFF